jgi:hypothetical protein
MGSVRRAQGAAAKAGLHGDSLERSGYGAWMLDYNRFYVTRQPKQIVTPVEFDYPGANLSLAVCGRCRGDGCPIDCGHVYGMLEWKGQNYVVSPIREGKLTPYLLKPSDDRLRADARELLALLTR